VMFAVYVGSALTTMLWLQSLTYDTGESAWFVFGIALWLIVRGFEPSAAAKGLGSPVTTDPITPAAAPVGAAS